MGFCFVLQYVSVIIDFFSSGVWFELIMISITYLQDRLGKYSGYSLISTVTTNIGLLNMWKGSKLISTRNKV